MFKWSTMAQRVEAFSSYQRWQIKWKKRHPPMISTRNQGWKRKKHSSAWALSISHPKSLLFSIYKSLTPPRANSVILFVSKLWRNLCKLYQERFNTGSPYLFLQSISLQQRVNKFYAVEICLNKQEKMASPQCTANVERHFCLSKPKMHLNKWKY